MLLFSTLLSVNESLTKEAFVDLVIEWNQKSTHKGNIIPDLVWNGEKTIRYGNAKLWMGFEDYEEKSIFATHFVMHDKEGVVWSTDYVFNYEQMKVAVRLERSYSKNAVNARSQFRIPYFITLLMNRGYLTEDKRFPVSQDPIYVNEENLNVLAKVINKQMKYYRLPIVYVSKTEDGLDPIDVNYLGRRLKGIAHVLVQENPAYNSQLMSMCRGKNEYNGAIGIYYPNHALRRNRYICSGEEQDKREIIETVVNNVRQYCNSQITDPLYTWQGVKNALLRDNMAKQQKKLIEVEAERRQEKDENELLLDEMQKELDDYDELKRQVEELTRLNEELKYENQELQNALQSTTTTIYKKTEGDVILLRGKEKDFFEGEVKDMVLSSLIKAMDSVENNTRRRHILEDIIINNDYQALCEEKAKKVKNLLKNYDGMSPKVKKGLRELGFEVEGENHPKIVYQNDSRYQTVYGGTPSDVRCGKNNASVTNKMAF